MQERTITVINPFDGSEKTETFYFKLSRSAALDMQLLERDDVEEYLRSVIEGQNGAKMLKVAREMILAAVGVKDGTRFVKTGVAERFVEEGFWDALFEELFQEENPMTFIIGILPDDIQREIAAENAKKEYTDEELMAMSEADFYRAAGVKSMDNMAPRFAQIAIARKQAKFNAQSKRDAA